MALGLAGVCLLAGPSPGPAQEAALDDPTTGTYSALVLFAKFAGEAPGDDSKPVWADDLFDPGLPGSFTHFYDEMSGGRLRVTGQVLPRRYASRNPAAAYLAATPGTLGEFARFNREILEQADVDVDMGRFDNDGPDGVANSGDDDGYVDVVFINLLTAPRDFFISGATGIATLGLKTDFLSDDAAAGGGVIRVRSQFSGFGGTTQRGHTFRVTAATLCHEFGHVLGLPDLFDQSAVTAEGELDPEQDSAGIGKWGLMGLGTLGWGIEDGPNAFSAWSLARLGWLGPGNERLVEVAATRRGVVLEPIDRGGEVLKIPLTADEYFLVENRQAGDSYYNRNIPAGGLLVWHVDERADNDEERHKQVDLVCADGLFADRGFPGTTPDPVAGGDNLDFFARDAAYASAHNGNDGDATDPFDGVVYRRLAFDTNPGLRGHAGGRRDVPVGIVLDDITALDDGRMRLDVLIHEPVEGNVTGTQTWSGTVAVDGDVIVEPGATLVVEAGTTVQLAGGDSRRTGFDAARTELIVYGELVVAGTPGAPVRFEVEPGSGRDWLGVLLLGGGHAGLDSLVDDGRLVLSDARLGLLRSRLPPGTTEWRGTRAVPWDLVVPAGAHLRLAAGSQLRFAAEDLSLRGRSPERAELVVEGRLTAAASGASPAQLTVDSRRSEALWEGVRLHAGGVVDASGLRVTQAFRAIAGQVSADGGLRLADSEVERAVAGLDLELFGDATVDGTSFRTISTHAVRAGGTGTLLLRGSTAQEIGQEAVFASNASLQLIDVRLLDSGVLDDDDPRSALAAEGGAGQRIELWNSTVTGSRLHGLQLDAWEGVVELHGTTVSGHRQDGLRASGAERVVFEEAVVSRNRGAGARLTDTVSEVWTTRFEDNVGDGLVVDGGSTVVDMSHFVTNGMRLQGESQSTVRRSEFLNASVGLHVSAAAPSLVGNRFEGNVTGLRVDGDPVPAPIRDNVFVGNGTALDNRSGVELDARGNYWGSTDSTRIAAQLAGAVAWVPFLPGEPVPTAVQEAGAAGPQRFALHRAWPNPFNAVTTIGFDLTAERPVRLAVYDVLGRLVRDLIPAAAMGRGHYRVAWDGADDDGRPAATGVYLFHLTAGQQRATGRVLLLR